MELGEFLELLNGRRALAPVAVGSIDDEAEHVVQFLCVLLGLVVADHVTDLILLIADIANEFDMERLHRLIPEQHVYRNPADTPFSAVSEGQCPDERAVLAADSGVTHERADGRYRQRFLQHHGFPVHGNLHRNYVRVVEQQCLLKALNEKHLAATLVRGDVKLAVLMHNLALREILAVGKGFINMFLAPLSIFFRKDENNPYPEEKKSNENNGKIN